MKKFKKTKACTAVLLLAALLTVEILYPLNMHDLFQQPNVVEAKETESAVDGSEGIKLVPDEDVDTADIVADGIDYEAIKEEIKEPEYREAVTYYDNRIAVIREEGEGTAKLEDTDWYQNNGATGYDVIASNNKVVDGKTVAETSYVVTINSEDVWDAVDNINTTGEVLIAEPDYIYSTAVEGNASEAPDTANDPGFEKEWYMNKLNTPSIWSDNETYGNTSGEGVVIAVIDTGVDYTHEDLKDNMWMNSAELFGNDGIDDDGNGYVDDYYGVSFISGKSDPMDDNGHGTHVAGIIAMEDNETGGVGIAYKSQIMAIKAGGSDGSFNSSDIAKAINYAVKNGADVINMSFGSYAHSAIMETALQTAFSRCVLVAAAGNDGMPTLDAVGYIFKGNMYPASYSYVIGVMASTQNNTLASFSNWDYKNNSGAEYEITAPGSEIYSTLPGNRYASWSGTSMAAPMVSAAAAIIRSSHSDKNTYSSRYIMGQLVSASTSSLTYVDTYGVPHIYSSLNVGDSLTKSPKPNINIDEVYIFDSPELSDKNNGDGVIQPGETVNIAIGVRNQWGAATDCYVSVDANSTGGVANPYVTFVNGKEVKIDDVGTFGTQNNGYIYNDEGTIVGVKNPIQIKISEDAPNDANIRLYVNYRAKNALDSKDTTVYTIEDAQRPSYTFRVQRGQTLSGKIESNMTLTKDNYYIVDNSLLIPKGVTVNVEPGTNIQFWSEDSNGVYADENIVYVKVEGVLNLNGSADEPIELFPGKGFESYRVEIQTDLSKSSSKVNMNYVNIINPYITADEGNHLNITQDYDSVDYRFLNDGYVLTGGGSSYLEFAKLSNSKVSNLRTNPYSPSPSLVQGGYDTVLFNDCYINGYMSKFTNCTFLGNQGRTEDAYSGALTYKTSILSNVGDRYTIPQYESSSVYTCNGKKYVIYKMSQYYRENNTFYDNIMILKDAIAKNGGCISSPEMPMNDNLANVLFSAVDEFDDENSITITTGYYYDFDTQKVVTASGEPVTGDAANCGISANLPLSCLTVGSPKNWYVGCAGNWQNAYVLAEYPTSVSDYQVINPVFGINDIDTSGDTAFTNNAILNRLTSKNVDDWMRITSSYDNTTVFNAKGNYYGTTDSKLISKIVRDFDTNISLADYIIDPILDKVSETTYPCVSDIYIKNSNGEVTDTVGNGTMEVHVLFNRDMDVTVSPEVTYGPDDPYSDYVVDGSFINTREWVGTVNVKVLINQGQQFFRVKDAVAADDEWLTTGTDWGRFNFYIEATGAEALTLQGEGLENEIKLSWTQDEYDTMAGYNVYRSETYDKTAEEPLKAFTKINNSLISADDKEYADTLVKPGKTYYYYFTVVDTDMTESRPSNVFQCAAIDNVAPVIKANIA